MLYKLFILFPWITSIILVIIYSFGFLPVFLTFLIMGLIETILYSKKIKWRGIEPEDRIIYMSGRVFLLCYFALIYNYYVVSLFLLKLVFSLFYFTIIIYLCVKMVINAYICKIDDIFNINKMIMEMGNIVTFVFMLNALINMVV